MPSNLDGSAVRRGSFGLGNYLASLVTLYLTAIHIGQVRRHIQSAVADSLRSDIRAMAAVLDETVRLCDPVAAEYAHRIRDVQHLAILGAGPSHATSLFWSAKTFELARINGVSQQLEEWAHEQFFLTGAGSQVVFVAPPGRSRSRVKELVHTARVLGATTVVVTDRDSADPDLSAETDVFLPVSQAIPEELSPLVYCVPGELLAIYLAQARGRNGFQFDSETQYVMNMKTIQESLIVESDA